MKKILVVFAEKCLGCRSCELACAVEHSQSKDLIKSLTETPLPQHRVEVETLEDFTIPLQCRHCEDAPCVSICPTHALQKSSPDSPVSLNDELCIGCKWCILVCPFGVIKIRRDGKAIVKCDLCKERTEKGLKPACVEACPTGALQFMEVEKVTREKKERFLVSLIKSEEKTARIRENESTSFGNSR